MISNEKRYLCLQKSLNVLVVVSEFDLQALNEFKSVLCNG